MSGPLGLTDRHPSGCRSVVGISLRVTPALGHVLQKKLAFLQKAFLLQHVAGGVGGLFEQDRPVLQPRCRRSVGAPKFPNRAPCVFPCDASSRVAGKPEASGRRDGVARWECARCGCSGILGPCADRHPSGCRSVACVCSRFAPALGHVLQKKL